MTHRSLGRHARLIVHAAEDTAPFEAAAPYLRQGMQKRRFDYAALLAGAARERALQEGANDLPARTGARGSGSHGFGAGQAHADAHPDAHPDPHATAHDGAGTPRAAAQVTQRLSEASAPIVEAVYGQQTRFLTLTLQIAREIAAWCADPHIAASGNWEAHLALDPALLPDTTLDVQLSRFHLSLRFNVETPSTRQVLSQHVSLLETELTRLLAAWREPREVDIVVA